MISSINQSVPSYRARQGCVSPSGSASRAAAPHTVYIPGPNCVYSGGDGLGQTAYAEYTTASTESDPIVRITGHSLSGDYDKTVHINEIDPENATYPELCALLGHRQKIGAYQPEHGMITGVPLGVDRGDFSQSQNFMQKINDSVSQNRRLGNRPAAEDGEALLRLYEKLLSRKKQDMETTPVDLLLEYIDRTSAYRSAAF